MIHSQTRGFARKETEKREEKKYIDLKRIDEVIQHIEKRERHLNSSFFFRRPGVFMYECSYIYAYVCVCKYWSTHMRMCVYVCVCVVLCVRVCWFIVCVCSC